MSTIKKRILLVLVAAVLCAVSVLPSVLAGEAAPEAEPILAAVTSAPASITVSGSAAVSVRPDVAYLYVGVTTEDKVASVAQAKNSEKMAAVIAKLGELGVGDEDISTESVTIYPNYDYSDPNSQTIKGYTANQTIKVLVRDIDSVGSVLDEAVAAGANQVNNIEFAVSDRDAAYDKAMEAAVLSAQKKAETLARAAGQTVVGITSIVEEAGYSYGPYYSKATMDTGAVAGAGTQVLPSWVDVSANLTVIFEME